MNHCDCSEYSTTYSFCRTPPLIWIILRFGGPVVQWLLFASSVAPPLDIHKEKWQECSRWQYLSGSSHAADGWTFSSSVLQEVLHRDITDFFILLQSFGSVQIQNETDVYSALFTSLPVAQGQNVRVTWRCSLSGPADVSTVGSCGDHHSMTEVVFVVFLSNQETQSDTGRCHNRPAGGRGVNLDDTSH